MKLAFPILFLVVVTCSFFNNSSSANEPTDANSFIRLEDYLTFAALNNAGLKAAFERWKSATEQITQAGTLPDPKFTYGYFIEEIETRTGPQRQKLSITQMFPWFGVIEARTDAVAATAKSAYKNYEALKLELFYDVKNLFYEYSYLSRAIEITKQNLALLQHFEEIARTRYTTSAGSHPDIIRAQIELALLEDKLQSLEEMRTPIVTGLNSVLNRQAGLALPWPERKPFQKANIDRESINATMLANNPQLQALDFELAAAQARLEIAKKKGYPDLTLGIDWIQTDDARSTNTRDSGKDPVIAMLSLNLPIWSESYKSAQEQAKAQTRSISAQKTQIRNDLIYDFENTLYDFEDTARKVDLFEGILIPKAQEMLEASEVAYQAGTIDFLSLIDAQRTLLDFELSYERLITTNLQKLAGLEKLIGREIE